MPVIALLNEAAPKLVNQAFDKGASEVMLNPYSGDELKHRVRRLLETRARFEQVQQEKQQIKTQMNIQSVSLQEAQVEMLSRLAHAGEYRDDETGEHVWRVAHTSWLLALGIGLSAEQASLILRASRLHDIGKICIPDSILRKPSKLSQEEFEVIKTHTQFGARLLSGGQSDLIRLAESIALHHHERWDGLGYPNNLKGEAIPIAGRIVALADTFDALTHDRIHQGALSIEDAVECIKEQSGKQFDPNIVDAFTQLYKLKSIPYEALSSSAILPAVLPNPNYMR
jgi:putative two-component system response regulator